VSPLSEHYFRENLSVLSVGDEARMDGGFPSDKYGRA
jgi:hypothetical protein